MDGLDGLGYVQRPVAMTQAQIDEAIARANKARLLIPGSTWTAKDGTKITVTALFNRADDAIVRYVTEKGEPWTSPIVLFLASFEVST